MTKHLYALATRLQRTLLAAGWPTPVHLAVMNDAWASLYRWHQAGEHVYRLRGGFQPPRIAMDTDLATAPVVRPGVCYVIDGDKWMVMARHRAMEPIVLRAPERVRAYDAPMLTYATEDGSTLKAGRLNLRDSPTPADLVMPAGASLGATGLQRLTGQDIAPEMLLLARVLPWYYSRQDED